MRSQASKNRNLTPPPPPPPPPNSGNSADNRSGESRKRPWCPPTVKTVALDQTFSGPNRSPITENETMTYFPMSLS